MKIRFLIFLLSFSFTQSLDSLDVAISNLRSIVENASRNGQRVLIDDFTGLDCPPCNWASLTVSDMLNEYSILLFI